MLFKHFFSIFNLWWLFSILNSGGHLVQWSETILAILVQSHERYISVKLFWNWAISMRGDVIWWFISIFSSGGHLVQWSETILAILVQGHLKNISVKLFCNWDIKLRRDVVQSYFSIFSSGAWEAMSFKGFSIFSSCSHLVHWCRTSLAITGL